MSRPPATTVYYGLEFLLSMPTWVVVAIYLVSDVGLTPFQLVVMGTAMEAAVFLFEVPTGVVADIRPKALARHRVRRHGHGLAACRARLRTMAALRPLGVVGHRVHLHERRLPGLDHGRGRVERIPVVFLRGARLSYAGALVGLGLSVMIATVRRGRRRRGRVVTALCGLACIVVMPETGFRRRPREERTGTFGELSTTALAGARFVRGHPVLLTLLGIAFFMGTASEAFDRLKEAHFIREVGLPAVGHLDPVVWFGGFAAIAMLFGFFAVGALQRRFERRGTESIARLLFVSTAVLAGAQLVFALTGVAAVAVATLLAALLARQLLGPLWDIWVNQQITDSSVRATVNSISGQADAIGQAAGGPCLASLETASEPGRARARRPAPDAGARALRARDPPRRPGSGARGLPAVAS